MLANHSLVELCLHVQQTGQFGASKLVQGNAGNGSNDGADILHRHQLVLAVAALFPAFPQNLQLTPQQVDPVTDFCRRLIVLVLHQKPLLLCQLADALLQFLQLQGLLLLVNLLHGTSLVQQVNSLVRQTAVRKIAAGKTHSGGNNLILIGDTVEGLVLLPDALQNQYGLLVGGLLHQHRLEPALQCRIPLEILTVFGGSGGSHTLQLATGQSGLEQVGGIHGPLRPTGTNECVELINKEDDVLVLKDFLQDALDPLLKLATILCSRHHRGQVKGDQPFFQQIAGNLTTGNPLGQALHNGSLAHAGITHQHGIVLGTAGKNLHHTTDLTVTAHHGIQLVATGQLRKVTAEFRQNALAMASSPTLLLATGTVISAVTMESTCHGPLAIFVGGLEFLIDALEGGVDLLDTDASLLEETGGDALLLPNGRQHQMLRTDIIPAETPGLNGGRIYQASEPAGGRKVAVGHRLVSRQKTLLQGQLEGQDINPQLLQQDIAQTIGVLEQCNQNMFRQQLIAATLHSLFLAKDGNKLLGPGRQILCHVFSSNRKMTGSRGCITESPYFRQGLFFSLPCTVKCNASTT